MNEQATSTTLDPGLSLLVQALAGAVASQIKADMVQISTRNVEPRLLDVAQAGAYLGRSEQAVQHLIFQRKLPVVRHGRRVHLDRHDLDEWIEDNKS